MAESTTREASAFTDAERTIRKKLGIPDAAKYVVFLDQAAHLDWDWLQTFTSYYEYGYSSPQAVKNIFSAALGLVTTPPPKGQPPYRYSVCEMGFFKHWIDKNPNVVAQIVAAGDLMRIVGGGITSPDNLLTAGEALIRNYLQGKLWLARTLPHMLPLTCAWLPDDFGHDPELPVSLRAMGFDYVSFSRIPGARPVTARGPLTTTLMSEGNDFFWRASDGSRVQAHWMQAGYGQGSSVDDDGDPVSAISGYLQSNDSNGSPNPPYSAAVTPYLFVPVDNDFMAPIADLVSDVQQWNTASGNGYATTGVYAVAASFADFAALVAAHAPKLKTRTEFRAIPYWTGFYMSRPENKVLHYRVTRGLLAAEALCVMAQADRTLAQDVSTWWLKFSPSTHHDFITGTAVDDVTENEQGPLLQSAATEASYDANSAFYALIGKVKQSPQAGETPVVAVNYTGAPFSGLVELTDALPADTRSVRFGAVATPVQRTEFGTGFMADVPSLGYSTGYASSKQAQPPRAAVRLTPANGGAPAYVLSNPHVSVTIAADQNWAIASATDVATGTPVLAGIGNQLVFYRDDGGIYEFGNETPGVTFEVETSLNLKPGAATVVEAGPLRAVVKASVRATYAGTYQDYTLTYTLVASEPFVRMTLEGAATSGYSVMVGFALVRKVDKLVHGTPNHWTAVQPIKDWWPAPIFQATHKFVIPQSNGRALGAIYHADVPAWAIDADGNLIGCVLRNTPGNSPNWGASGTDNGTHKLTYALRVPSGLTDPATCGPLIEATQYASIPLAGMMSRTTGTFPESGSAASITRGNAMIVAAKQGDVDPASTVLRIYQPSNTTQTLEVTMAIPPARVVALTALEDPITSGGPVVTVAGKTITVTASTALITLGVT